MACAGMPLDTNLPVQAWRVGAATPEALLVGANQPLPGIRADVPRVSAPRNCRLRGAGRVSGLRRSLQPCMCPLRPRLGPLHK